MDLQADEAVDHVDAFLLQLFGPGDVALLVEAGLELHHGHYLFAAAPGLDEGAHDGRIVARTVQGLLDGQDVGVLAGAADKVQHGLEAVVGMEEHHVPLAQVAEHVAFLEQARDVPLDAGRLELGPVHIIEGHEFGKAHGPLDAVDLEGLQAQAPGQKVHQLARGLVGDLQPHHVAEAALFHQVAHGFQQVVGLVLFDLQIGVAGDAEQGGADHRMAGEEQVQILGHEVFQQHDVVTAHVGVEAQGGVGLGLLVARDEDEAREVVGALQAHEARFVVAVAQLDDEIEAGGGDGGEGVPRVDGLGREHGIDLVAEIAVQEAALLFRKIGVAHDAHAPFQQLRSQVLEPVALCA